MEKSCRKYAPKASPRPFFILVNNLKQPLHAGHSCKRTQFFLKEDYQKLSLVFFFFLKTQSLLMEKII